MLDGFYHVSFTAGYRVAVILRVQYGEGHMERWGQMGRDKGQGKSAQAGMPMLLKGVAAGRLLMRGRADEFAMEAEEEMVGHAGDVVADDEMGRRRRLRGFGGVERRHRGGAIHVVAEQLFERGDGVFAVFDDGRILIKVREEKCF